MGLGRRLVEGAFKKLDEINERDQARAVAKLTPAERERYDAWTARTEALHAGATVDELGDPRLIAKVLQGPAGEELHGVVKAPKRPAPIDDPAAWEAQAAAERAARDEVRAPYLAPERAPVRIARVLAQERTQAREVGEYLASSGLAGRPDLVYGVYRVPDAIDLGKLLGAKVVEWDVVHAGSDGELPPAATPAAAFFDAGRRWVDRTPGEPSPLDEDLGLDVLARAGIGPERTLGIARELTISHRGGDSDEPRRGPFAGRDRDLGLHVGISWKGFKGTRDSEVGDNTSSQWGRQALSGSHRWERSARGRAAARSKV